MRCFGFGGFFCTFWAVVNFRKMPIYQWYVLFCKSLQTQSTHPSLNTKAFSVLLCRCASLSPLSSLIFSFLCSLAFIARFCLWVMFVCLERDFEGMTAATSPLRSLHSFCSSIPRRMAEDQALLQLLWSTLQDTVAVVWHDSHAAFFSLMWWSEKTKKSPGCGLC